MSTDRELTSIVRSWLDKGVNALPDRVLDAVLDQVPTIPQRRAWWPARRLPTLNTYARLAVAAAAVVLAAVVGIGLYGNSVGRQPVPTTLPTASPPPESNPLTGTWETGMTTCAEQNAAVEAAGFTARQMTVSDWTCNDMRQFTIRFGLQGGQSDIHSLRAYGNGQRDWDGSYRIIDDATFEAGDLGDGLYYITYRYAIDGDQLTIDMIEDRSPREGQASRLGEQMVQTAIYETSTFTRQP